MSTIIEKARKGNRPAMTQLADANKAQIYHLCLALTCNETEATNGTSLVFRQLWEPVMSGKLASEQAVTEFLVKRAIGHCKTRLLKKDAKAFRVPANKNFATLTCNPSAIRPDIQPAQQLLVSLPPLHRTVYVLSGVLGLSNGEIGDLVGLSPDLVEQALAAEESCLSTILTLRQERLGECLTMDAEAFHDTLRKNVQTTPIPAAVNSAITAEIDTVAKPLECKARWQRNTMLSVLAACVLVAILVFAVRGLSGGEVTFTTSNDGQTSSAQNDDEMANETAPKDIDLSTIVFVPEMQEITCYADIEIQGYGTITVALDGLSAPKTVENFVELANSGFYDGLTFHRIIDGFMMQGGDPQGDGFGGSDKTIPGEFTSNGVANPLTHTAGAISMARSSRPNSASSQFFIVHEDSTFLDGDYAVFGYVIEGMDIVDAICTSAQPTDGNGTIPAGQQPIITSITIREADDSSMSNAADLSVDPTTDETGDSSAELITGETWDISQEPTTDETTGG